MRATPFHALSAAERAAVLSAANEPRFADVPPARIVPALADEGIYLASESTFARVLRAHGQNAHRGRAKAPRVVRPPTTHIARAPRQVWCWDMTYLPTKVVGQWFYLYLILYLYSHKIVGWEVHASDDSQYAAHLVRRTALAEGIAMLVTKPVLHGDNGATLKATTVLAMLNWLGIKPSYSRPRVSDDNLWQRDRRDNPFDTRRTPVVACGRRLPLVLVKDCRRPDASIRAARVVANIDQCARTLPKFGDP